MNDLMYAYMTEQFPSVSCGFDFIDRIFFLISSFLLCAISASLLRAATSSIAFSFLCSVVKFVEVEGNESPLFENESGFPETGPEEEEGAEEEEDVWVGGSILILIGRFCFLLLLSY